MEFDPRQKGYAECNNQCPTETQRGAELTPALVVRELSRSEFDRFDLLWDDLVRQYFRDEPFFKHQFLRIWVDNFSNNDLFRALVVTEGEKLLAGLALLEDKTWVKGIPIRRLRVPANVHSNRFDFICQPGREDAAAALWAYCRDNLKFDLVEFVDVPENGSAWQLLSLAKKDGYAIGSWESMKTPFVPLIDSSEKKCLNLDKHFFQNLRRRRRKLEKRGRLEFQRFDGGRELEIMLEEGFALEKSGWKGREGTAIACDSKTRGFYAEWARKEAQTGNLSFYFLRLNGSPIAFQFGLSNGRAYFLPKTCYDEGHADCSPGQLLMDNVIEDCLARGIKEFDFLGPSMNWKLDWTSHVRPHYWLYIYGQNFCAKTLSTLRSWWSPVIRGRLKKCQSWARGVSQEVWSWKR